MKDKRYVVYGETGTNTHHYFEKYEEARDYVVNNNMHGMRIAKLLAYSAKPSLVELGDCNE